MKYICPNCKNDIGENVLVECSLKAYGQVNQETGVIHKLEISKREGVTLNGYDKAICLKCKHEAEICEFEEGYKREDL